MFKFLILLALLLVGFSFFVTDDIFSGGIEIHEGGRKNY